MTETKTLRMSMADYVRELCHTTQHREHFEVELEHANGSTTRYGTDHITVNPPLIEQLWGALRAGSSQGGEIGSAHPGSRPAASLDAIDAAARIDLAASRWVRDLGEDDPLDTIGCVLRLNGLAASTNRCGRAGGSRKHQCCTYHQIEVDIRSWWVQARVLTGWDSPAWKPDATCPLCGDRRTVSIRWSAQLATCTNCHESWDPETIGMLAEHIRLEAEEGRFRKAPTPIPCQCEFPRDEQVGRIMVCPDCGSRYCVKVQDHIVPTLRSHKVS